MPPTPPTAARRCARALLLFALPLLLGFATGALLASDPPPERAPSRVVERSLPTETDDERLDRERRRARSRDHRARLAAAATRHDAQVPTRRSVQQAIDAIDPSAWLASYGTVTEAPLERPVAAR